MYFSLFPFFNLFIRQKCVCVCVYILHSLSITRSLNHYLRLSLYIESSLSSLSQPPAIRAHNSCLFFACFCLCKSLFRPVFVDIFLPTVKIRKKKKQINQQLIPFNTYLNTYKSKRERDNKYHLSWGTKKQQTNAELLLCTTVLL